MDRLPDSDIDLPGEGPLRRHDWFRELWEERHAHWSKRLAQDRRSVVFVGDSITQDWGDDLGGRFPGMKVANRGISGDTTRGVLIRLERDVLSLDPLAVVVLAGTNDLEEGAEPETIASNMALIVRRLEAGGRRMPILVCEVFPSSPSLKRPPERIIRVNRLYADLVANQVRDRSPVTLVPIWSALADGAGNARPEEFPDLLHPNERGYERWAAALQPALVDLGLFDARPREKDGDT